MRLEASARLHSTLKATNITIAAASQRIAPQSAIVGSAAPITAARLPSTSAPAPTTAQIGIARQRIRQASTIAIATSSTSSVPVPEK
jgi:hypothetical protein